MKYLRKNSSQRSGQGLVEYIILIGLIALVVFGIIKTFGSDLESQFKSADKQMSGISSNFNK